MCWLWVVRRGWLLSVVIVVRFVCCALLCVDCFVGGCMRCGVVCYCLLLLVGCGLSVVCRCPLVLIDGCCWLIVVGCWWLGVR